MFKTFYPIFEKVKGPTLLSFLPVNVSVLGKKTKTKTISDAQENDSLPGVNITSSMQMGKGSIEELSDVGYFKINDLGIIIKKN
ncbi:MAG: hypothetical protein JXB49_23760 [Bacteroidales bacterium]|nr:hypothetical protein [Bacteroidales bacterium]